MKIKTSCGKTLQSRHSGFIRYKKSAIDINYFALLGLEGIVKSFQTTWQCSQCLILSK